MVSTLSSDDELRRSLSVETRNGESEDLMEAVKESRRAPSPANESKEREDERERERQRERGRERGAEQRRDGPVKGETTRTPHVPQSTTLTWVRMDPQSHLSSPCSEMHRYTAS